MNNIFEGVNEPIYTHPHVIPNSYDHMSDTILKTDGKAIIAGRYHNFTRLIPSEPITIIDEGTTPGTTLNAVVYIMSDCTVTIDGSMTSNSRHFGISTPLRKDAWEHVFVGYDMIREGADVSTMYLIVCGLLPKHNTMSELMDGDTLPNLLSGHLKIHAPFDVDNINVHVVNKHASVNVYDINYSDCLSILAHNPDHCGQIMIRDCKFRGTVSTIMNTTMSDLDQYDKEKDKERGITRVSAYNVFVERCECDNIILTNNCDTYVSQLDCSNHIYINSGTGTLIAMLDVEQYGIRIPVMMKPKKKSPSFNPRNDDIPENVAVTIRIPATSYTYDMEKNLVYLSNDDFVETYDAPPKSQDTFLMTPNYTLLSKKKVTIRDPQDDLRLREEKAKQIRACKYIDPQTGALYKEYEDMV